MQGGIDGGSLFLHHVGVFALVAVKVGAACPFLQKACCFAYDLCDHRVVGADKGRDHLGDIVYTCPLVKRHQLDGAVCLRYGLSVLFYTKGHLCRKGLGDGIEKLAADGDIHRAYLCGPFRLQGGDMLLIGLCKGRFKVYFQRYIAYCFAGIVFKAHAAKHGDIVLHKGIVQLC